eukprot:11648725-Heterocapsa_arctica.AAC.1
MKEVPSNMECIMKTKVMNGNSMTSYKVSTKTMKINPKHSVTNELKKKAVVDMSEQIAENLNWLLFDISLLTSGVNL